MNNRQKISFTILCLIGLLLVASFAIWWFQLNHIANNFGANFRFLDIIFFALVTFVIWHPIIMNVLSWSIGSHIKKRQYFAPEPGLKVAVITTFVPGSESNDLLEKTLPSLIAIKYPHDTWLLDEGDDPKVKALCEKYGVNHFSRKGIDYYNVDEGKFAKRTKGGNHNSWYDKIGKNYDIVAQMDTDFIAHKDYLMKTLGYFRDPDIAFVGTPQIYGNIKDSLIANGAAQQTYNFYGPILRGMDGMGTTMLIGANHVIRVSALKNVNFYSAHITEDLLTGMKLHAGGWKSAYVHEALAIGEGPTDWKSFFAQQKRWAYGCMHILFNHSPKLFKNMNIKRSVYYFFIQQHYFTGLVMAVSAICLLMYFGFGLNTTRIELFEFLKFYIPVIIYGFLMDIWVQRFNVRPKKERGIFWAGMYVSVAAWPVFFMGFLELFKSKKMVFKVTPKGSKARKTDQAYLNLFLPHLAIALISLSCAVSAIYTQRDSPLMILWAVITGILMLLVPIIVPIFRFLSLVVKNIILALNGIIHQYKLFEFKASDLELLPTPPSDTEKYLFSKRKMNYLIIFSFISFGGVTISMYNFLSAHPQYWILGIMLTLSIIYFAVSLIVNSFTKEFDLKNHLRLVKIWSPVNYPSVDIFLPVAGEPLRVLKNTWEGVKEIVNHYPGQVKVYCLDDSGSTEVRQLANNFSFIYSTRENRGYFKKAGNLRHGFEISSGDFILILDADFVPRKDILNELLPYFYKNPKLGIAQSPQYFDVDQNQNWLERGAGAVQELFYRSSQVSRQHHNASICVGSNALYRRVALNSTGGTALIEHSEDVHTGFNLRSNGWDLQYVPIILAKGLCPSSMSAFFKQQYRWCMGSLSLLSSTKFWSMDMKFKTRLSYASGFLYYVHTGLTSIYLPIVPIILLIFLPSEIYLINYLLILPAFIFTQLIYPIWHRSTYGIEAWTTRVVYGWAHLFAIFDILFNKPMGWQATGTKVNKNFRYMLFRLLQIIFNLLPAIIWMGIAAYYCITVDLWAYLPIFLSGIYYLLISLKIAIYIYTNAPAVNHFKLSKQLTIS